MTEERTRIARELHDVVAHAMTVMVVQASGARRVLETSPERRSEAIEALTHVESTGREGLADQPGAHGLGPAHGRASCRRAAVLGRSLA